MAITRNADAQWPLVRKVEFTYEDLENGVDLDAIAIPGDSAIQKVTVVLSTLFNAGTLDVILSDDSAPVTVLSSIDITTDAVTTAVPDGTSALDGQFTDEPKYLQLTLTGTGLTQGEGYLLVEYVQRERANEVYAR